MYHTERYESKTTVDHYMENYVDIPCFLEYCKECKNYKKSWSCPPFDFSVEDYWKQYRYLHLIGTKIIFDEETLNSVNGRDDVQQILNDVLDTEKIKLSEKLYEVEKRYPDSISLSAGSCSYCKTCERILGNPCTYPDKIRYSIEALGGNVGLTCSKLMNIELLWSEEGKLPAYFTVVSGFLSNEEQIEF